MTDDWDEIDVLTRRAVAAEEQVASLQRQLQEAQQERDITVAELEARLSDAQQWLDSEPDWKAKFIAHGETLRKRAEALEAQCATQAAHLTALRVALVALVGTDGREELEQLEAAMRLMPAPAADKAASIDAIHALIATLPVALAAQKDRPQPKIGHNL